MDYGTQNAFAALLWEKHKDVWYATREYYYSGRDTGAQKTDAQYKADLDAWIRDVAPGATIRTIIDPSAASFIAVLRQSKDRYKVQPADNAVLDGIRETATAMQTGLVKFSPKLKHWRMEVEGYTWDETSSEDRPVKVNDHAQDAARYFVKTMKVIRRHNRPEYIPAWNR